MGVQVDISASTCIAAAFLCLILPLPWVIAAVTAAIIHELFHILAVCLCGGRIHSLTVGIHGAVMHTSFLNVPQQLVCILAGPAGSLLLIPVGRYVPRLALCGLVQGLYNLLPIYPLDGGRGLRCMTESLFLPETANKICKVAEIVVVSVLVCLCFRASFVQKLGIAPVIFSVLLVSKVWIGKKSCKEGLLGVQ